MSFRKTRVHLMGKSNADARTISTSPVSNRLPLHEKQPLNTSAMITRTENPIERSILKYKTWSKKTKLKNQESSQPDYRMFHDPPDFADVKQKVENLRVLQKNKSESALTESFSKFIQSSGVSLKSKFAKMDKQRKGIISLEEFREVLDDIGAPSNLLKNSSKLFEELGGKDESLNYPSLFTHMFSSTLPILPNIEKEAPTRVIDKRSVPPNQLENIFNYGKRIRQFLKSQYKNPESLISDLSQISKSDHISLHNLKSFITSKLSEDKTIKVTQRELEGFLGSYDYNKDLDTSTKEVAKYIFLDEIVAANYLHLKKRAIPPLRSTNSADGVDVNRLKKLLLDIEHKVFTQGPNQTLPAFKLFDKDNDGYLTIEDLEQGLSLIQVPHSSEDTQKLMNFLDENSNGFVTFAEFSKVIQPNIITINHVKLNESDEKHLNISQPSTTFYLNQKKNLPEAFIPSLGDTSLKIPTRYSSSPPVQNTFTNFAPSADSAMFLGDKEKFSAKKFEPINLNHEDKKRLKTVADGRIDYLRKTREAQEFRVKEKDDKELALENQKIIIRARMKNDYETKCKMGIIS